MILRHIANPQALDTDDAVLPDEFGAFFVQEISSQVSDTLVDFGELGFRSLSPVAAFLAAVHDSAGPLQPAKVGPVVPRVADGLAVGGVQKRLQPEVEPHRFWKSPSCIPVARHSARAPAMLRPSVVVLER